MRLLLVDDEPEILKLLQRQLEREDFEVDIEPDPRRALERMREQLYNIVITDIRLPGMSGFELIRAMKAIHPLVNILVITGYPSMSYIVDCLSAGALDYFTKPIQRLDLFVEAVAQCKARIERWLGAVSLGSDHAQSVAV
jgi:DNA-binding response OmpR family regulator